MGNQERKTLTFHFLSLFRANVKYLRKKVFKPYVKMLCLRLILFYQKIPFKAYLPIPSDLFAIHFREY